MKCINEHLKKYEHLYKIIPLIISIVFSSIAIFQTIQISQKSEKIDLFNQRFELYQSIKILNEVSSVARNIEDFQLEYNGQEVLLAFVDNVVPEFQITQTILSQDSNLSDNEKKKVFIDAKSNLTKLYAKLESSKYIFNFDDKQQQNIDYVIEQLRNMTAVALGDATGIETINILKDISQKLNNEEIFSTMKEQLDI